MTTEIEFVQGNEHHTSYWGEFYVKGLEQYQVKEDHENVRHDRHHSYSCFVNINVPPGTVFTYWEKYGNKYGTISTRFAICEVVEGESSHHEADYGNGFVRGNFREVCRAEGRTKAPRLLKWWVNSEEKTLQFAEHCAKWINKRGLDQVPPLAQKVPN